MTARTEMRHDSQDRITVTGKPAQDRIIKTSWDIFAWTGQTGQTERIDAQNRTVGTGQSEQDSWDRTVRT
jgi:hypothetical protein